MISFFVPGLPVAQPRQRHRVAFVGNRAVAQNYTPKTDPVQTWKATIRLIAGCQAEPGMWEGPLQLRASFVFPRPKSKTRKKNEGEWKASKPDWDNLGKALCDALNGVLWRDDAQLAFVSIGKSIAGDGEPVGVKVQVEKLT